MSDSLALSPLEEPVQEKYRQMLSNQSDFLLVHMIIYQKKQVFMLFQTPFLLPKICFHQKFWAD